MSSFCIQTSPSKGRHVVAETDYEFDQLVFETKPYAFGVFESFRKRVCVVCLAQNETGAFHLHCKKCDQVYVCSANCLNVMMAQAHHIVCSSLRKLATFKASAHEKGILKILLMTLHKKFQNSFANPISNLELEGNQHGKDNVLLKDATSLFNAFQSQNQDEKQQDTNDRQHDSQSNHGQGTNKSTTDDASSYENKDVSMIDQNNNKASSSSNIQINHMNYEITWEDVERLQSHLDDWPLEELREWRKTRLFALKLLAETGLLNDHPDPESFIMNFVSKIESNCFGIFTSKGTIVGRAIYPLASFFNHSCDPNCHVIQDTHTLTIKTLRPLEAGSELTISYIDVNQPLSSRRRKLKEEYFFLCTCDRCVQEDADRSSAAKISYKKSESSPGPNNINKHGKKGNNNRNSKSGFNDMSADTQPQYQEEIMISQNDITRTVDSVNYQQGQQQQQLPLNQMGTIQFSSPSGLDVSNNAHPNINDQMINMNAYSSMNPIGVHPPRDFLPCGGFDEQQQSNLIHSYHLNQMNKMSNIHHVGGSGPMMGVPIGQQQQQPFPPIPMNYNQLQAIPTPFFHDPATPDMTRIMTTTTTTTNNNNIAIMAPSNNQTTSPRRHQSGHKSYRGSSKSYLKNRK